MSSTLVLGEFRRHCRKISRESTIFFLGTVLTSAASYFFKIYLARTIGAEALGLYALGMTVVGFAGVAGAVDRLLRRGLSESSAWEIGSGGGEPCGVLKTSRACGHLTPDGYCVVTGESGFHAWDFPPTRAGFQ